MVYDVAHNPEGFKRLLEALELHFPGRPFRMFLGFSQDKEILACLKVCIGKARRIYLSPHNPHGALPQTARPPFSHFELPNVFDEQDARRSACRDRRPDGCGREFLSERNAGRARIKRRKTGTHTLAITHKYFFHRELWFLHMFTDSYVFNSLTQRRKDAKTRKNIAFHIFPLSLGVFSSCVFALISFRCKKTYG